MADQSYTLTLPSPAKINLFLHIIGKRLDGYHDLQTVFQFLSLKDTLSFKLEPEEIILESQLPDVKPEDNLIFKAAQLLKQTTGCTQGARIYLEKNIPMGGGFGGGSSNAATTLIALNRLWELNLSTEALLPLARQLGADVSIFIYGHAAFAEGTGDKFIPVNPPEPWYVILMPPVHVSTVAMFKHPQLSRNTAPITVDEYLNGYPCHNDFSPLVCQEYPVVRETLDWLKQFGPACLTGSGAGLFLPCQNKAQAQDIIGQIPAGMIGCAAQGQNQSPLIY
ncbi:MAG: 4-(cytidine 5'-diphospho)-2-C-methyl-D-erythritol kinase [Legionellales bacterium]|jgi:4-diphosphocytidyl-2-C-methyl-D-erythritol kinase